MFQNWTHCFFFFIVRRILRNNAKSMEQRGIFVQIQIKIVSTKLNLWTITASNLKLSPKISTLFFANIWNGLMCLKREKDVQI